MGQNPPRLAASTEPGGAAALRPFPGSVATSRCRPHKNLQSEKAQKRTALFCPQETRAEAEVVAVVRRAAGAIRRPRAQGVEVETTPP